MPTVLLNDHVNMLSKRADCSLEIESCGKASYSSAIYSFRSLGVMI